MKSNIHVALAAVLLLGSSLALAGDSKVSLTGKEEVPAVETAATGSGTITVGADKSVSGSVKTKGIEGVAAHIHQAAAGKNGPPIIMLEKGDGRRMERAEGLQAHRRATRGLQGWRAVRQRAQRRAQRRRDSRAAEAVGAQYLRTEAPAVSEQSAPVPEIPSRLC